MSVCPSRRLFVADVTSGRRPAKTALRSAKTALRSAKSRLAFASPVCLDKVEVSHRRSHSSRANSGEARALGEVLGFLQLLWDVAHELESVSKRMRSTVGVTGPQRLVVRLVGHYEHPSPGELAEALRVHPSSLTGVLRRLERAGLVRRTRDPNDGRRAIVTLTSKGQRLNDRHFGTAESGVRRALKAMPAREVTATRSVLRRVADELAVETLARREPTS
jgi:MarR family transcriptional regulator, organic hydroperoxide resistance regulator